MSKKLEQKQARREAEERRKAENRKAAVRRNAVTIGTAVLVGVIVVAAIVYQRSEIEKTTENVGVAAEKANCEGVESPEEMEDAGHIAVGEQHEPYNSTPPTSGPMYEQTASAGFSTEPIPAESLVHNLEHGYIVIWYHPDADQETLNKIELLVDQEPAATIAAPYEEIEQPHQFALGAWGNYQLCEDVSQEVVDGFRRKFQGKSPEQVVPPFEG